jgi:signal transduction histidine kinase
LPGQSSKSTLFVGIIITAALVTSLISYQYTSTTSEQIQDIASQESRASARIQAQSLSTLLANEIESISDNLETIAASKAIQAEDIDGALPLLTASQKSTGDLTSAYGWLDKNGRILLSTSWSTDATSREQFQGADFSFREYFSQPKEMLKPYYSTVFEGVDGAPRLSVSYPIIGSDGSFEGVVVAGMEVKTFGQFVQKQLSPDYRSNVGLVDRDGVVLYSSSSPQNVGKNIFGPELQSAIPADIKEPFNEFIQDSLNGNSGSGDFTTQGRISTVAYGPVNVLGSDFALLYIVTPHELAGSAAALIDQQSTLNLVTIGLVGVVAAGLASAVAIWNKRLGKEVVSKTSELKFANDSIAQANKELQIANTKLRETNEELAQAYEQVKLHDKLQNEFVNVAAHELRTPVQPLLGAAELMESQFDGKEKIEVTRPEIEMILRNAKRLERLSSDILDISRIESGALKLNKEDFSLAYIVADGVKDAKAQSIFDPERLSIAYNPDDIFVHGDRDKIAQVITNLLTNAIKFTRAGTISITTKRDRDNGLAVIQVIDTGSGIDMDILSRLFEKFVTKSEKGTGIGLYISKKIVEAHGGTINGNNNSDGPGATFKFTLPLSQQDVERAKDAGLVSQS